jgi:hypothetical protein
LRSSGIANAAVSAMAAAPFTSGRQGEDWPFPGTGRRV